jgi:benzoyl-CoA reductase subunit C
MNEVFIDAAKNIENNEIKKWKSNGKKVIGYTCSYLPAELLFAADILPIRMRGIETKGMEIGDAYFGPYICSFPKCILQLAGSGKFSFYDGAIIIPGCDSMRRLDECWRKANEDKEGVLPDFFYYFDVPHKIMPHGFDWFTEEIKKLKQEIEKHFSITLTDEKIKNAISTYNEGRKLLKEFALLRERDDQIITGEDIFTVAIAASTIPRDIFNIEMKKYLKELSKKKNDTRKGKRIMLLGSANDDINFINLIEKSGITIVSDNLCYGIESETEEVSTDGDLIVSLAKRYLLKSDCPRMFGLYKERLNGIKEKIKNSKADGVIMQNIRFCDLHGSEHGIFERDLEKEGIPCLRLEREYGPLVETGRIKMRIDAFIERIS